MNISLQIHKSLHDAIATKAPRAGSDENGFYSVVFMPASWNAAGEKLPAYWIVTGFSGPAAVSRIRGNFILYPSILGALEWE